MNGTSDGFDRAPATAGACVMPAMRYEDRSRAMEWFRRRKWRMRVLWVMTPAEGEPWTITAQREQQQAALEQER